MNFSAHTHIEDTYGACKKCNRPKEKGSIFMKLQCPLDNGCTSHVYLVKIQAFTKICDTSKSPASWYLYIQSITKFVEITRMFEKSMHTRLHSTVQHIVLKYKTTVWKISKFPSSGYTHAGQNFLSLAYKMWTLSCIS